MACARVLYVGADEFKSETPVTCFQGRRLVFKVSRLRIRFGGEGNGSAIVPLLLAILDMLKVC